MSAAAGKIPTIVLGGTGYVAGELLRLVAGHPGLELRAALSDSQPGELVAASFAHLRPAYPELKFSSLDEVRQIVASLPVSAILSAAPHGVSAGLIDSLLSAAEAKGAAPRVADISADFRYATAAAYEAVYKHPHGAPGRLAQFTCAVPEHLDKLATRHVAHPGCFATAILLASVPLLKLKLIEPALFVAGITGSTGSGRSPTPGTHHPQRHSDLYAYNALGHRHTPEITALAAAASGVEANFRFVPHSGPFARGIHVTVQAKARQPIKTGDLLAALGDFYQSSPLVHVGKDMPRIKDVAASNYARIGAVADGETVAVMCAIDNLAKGAAGGAIQWMNRMLGLPETMGLAAPAPGWT
ncbi:MAG: N-acetyl-gamma-glutamyl-phosphate reductase [Alphaproteobacteria bacterium]